MPVIKWGEFRGNIKKLRQLLICYARLTQCSKPVKNRKKLVFFNLFVQIISGWSSTVVGRGYFSHASSYSENVASARTVLTGASPGNNCGTNFGSSSLSCSANVANCIYSGGFSCVLSVITRPETDKRAQQTQCQREKIVGNTENECKDTPRFL